MELLTDRLAMLVEQVAENQMAELINKEKLQQQRIMERSQREKMLSFQVMAAQNQERRTRRPTFNGKKRDERNDDIKKQEPKVNEEQMKLVTVAKVATVCDIWGSNKTKSKTDKGDDTNDPTKQDTEPKPKPKPNLFRKIAKTTVLMGMLKQGHDICTCEDLNSKCKVHDS